MPGCQRGRFTGDLHFPYRQLILCVPACAKLGSIWMAQKRSPGLRYLFEDYVLDIDKRELRRGADAVSITPQVFDLLDYLIRNRERVVSKDDLISTVWQGRIVSDAALTTRLNAARSAIGDNGERQRLIKTLPRKGFRFAGDVTEELTLAPEPAAGSSMPATAAPALPDKPSLAVLPFANLSGDPEQEYFADAMVEEITAALSRFRSLFVIACGSTFTYKGRRVDFKKIGRELGVRYLLGGSVRREVSRLRLTGQLIDASSGVHLWAERFEGTLTELFSLQDQMTEWVVGAIMPKLSRAELERAKQKPPHSLNAYDCYLRGVSSLGEDTREATNDGERYFFKAIELDTSYARAYAHAALCFETRLRNGWISDFQAESKEAKKLAWKAIEFGREDSFPLGAAGFVLAVLGDIENAAPFIDRALALNPNSQSVWHYSAWVYILLGKPELAIEHATRAIRFSPVDPWLGATQTAIAFAEFFMGSYEKASRSAAEALRVRPSFQPALRIAAASYALAGKVEEAQGSTARLLALNPDLRISHLYYLWKCHSANRLFAEFLSRYEKGLRKAGLQR
jgi:TolB-like protein/tetratricopeptide (TPR) repeat protein